MREHGFDREVGLQLETRDVAGGAEGIEVMAAGALELCTVGIVPVMTAAQRGLIPGAIVPVAANNVTDAQHRVIAVLAAPSIKAWRELAGQPIAVNARDSIGAAAIVGRLKQEGVRE